MTKINEDITYYDEHNNPRQGYYLHEYIKSNIDRFAVKRIKHKLDNIFVITGLEGSGKTTLSSAIANYLDPTFPGKLLEDGTPRRSCDRIVFTLKQIMEAIDKSKPGQSIQIDEAIITLGSQDASNEFQKLMIKKFTTIRKKRLNIFLLIPNFFLLRKPIAVFRSFALFNTHLSQGYRRGTGSCYSYDTKQKLYFIGVKDHSMRHVRADFHFNFTNTHGFFYNIYEYDQKKENAIKVLSETAEGAGTKIQQRLVNVKKQRDKLIFIFYSQLRERYLKSNQGGKYTSAKFANDLFRLYKIHYSPQAMNVSLKSGREQFGLAKRSDYQFESKKEM